MATTFISLVSQLAQCDKELQQQLDTGGTEPAEQA